MFSHILVAVDGSDHASHAARVAGEMAARYDARLTILYIIDEGSLAQLPAALDLYEVIEHVHITELDVLKQAGEKIVERAQQAARDAGATNVTASIETGEPGHAIADYAREHNADVIVMGTRGLGDSRALLFGSVSHKVVQLATCPVLLVK